MKNKTTWYLIVEMNDGEWRSLGDWGSRGTAKELYKSFVRLSITGGSHHWYCGEVGDLHERVLYLTDVKTIKLISVENRGNHDR